MNQYRSKHLSKAHVVVWTLLAVLVGAVGFIIWNAVEEGRVLSVAVPTAIAVIVAWRANRQAERAKQR